MRKIFETTLLSRSSELFFLEKRDEIKEIINPIIYNSIIVCDENTAYLSPESSRTIVLKSGESEKNFETLKRILSFALEMGLSRDSYFIALGGGVVSDITALASSLFMRGSRLIIFPTTLLSMVDATLGGKSAIDFEDTKNIVGTFYPAEKIYIAPFVLSTLSEREYLSGMGEVVKHAFLSSDENLYRFLYDNASLIMQRDENTLYKMIEESLLVKRSYVERDEEETKGIRSALNFGHTFGHALESISGYTISHGEGVVWGMKKALTGGMLLGVTPPSVAVWALDLISKFPFRSDITVSKKEGEHYLSAIEKDKKKRGGEVKFVFLSDMGEVKLQPLTKEQIMSLVL